LLRRVVSSAPPPAMTTHTSLFTPLPPPEASRLHSLYEPTAIPVSVPYAPRRLPMLNEITGVVEELPSIFTLPQGKAKAKTKPKTQAVKTKRQIARKRK
jgi:hypothetical protein